MLKNKEDVKKKDKAKCFFTYVGLGVKKLTSYSVPMIVMLALFLLEVAVCVKLQTGMINEQNWVELFASRLWGIALGTLFVTADVFLLYFLGKPTFFRDTEADFIRSDFINSLGEAPILLERAVDPTNSRVKIYTFDSNAIPLCEWEKKKEYIESALNITILGLEYTKGKRNVVLRFVNADGDFPTKIDWDNQLLSNEDFVLTLGIGADSMPVQIDLNVIPMVLIGGATGSGKSVLLKLLLMQSLNKGAEVIISDFKGGVDFPSIWHQKCQLLFDETTLLEVLNKLVKTIEDRKQILKESGFANIHEFNQHGPGGMQRIIFACDEVAELLDTRGLPKDQKDLVNQIEAALSTIARQGRAFGVHLILATQRPDATIIPGQIKNNCQCKMCGACDQVLSQIVLDCTDASDTIPKNIPGRFMLNDLNKTVFQCFLFDEEQDLK